MKTLFLFPGQGSQYIGMAKAMAESNPSCKALLDEADDVLGFKLSKIMFEGPEEDLKATQNTQPALFVASQLAVVLMNEAGIQCDVAAGHSLGEYSALCGVGALKFGDALKLVRLRGELMAEAGVRRPGAMAAVLGMELAPLQAAIDSVKDKGVVVPANFNSPGQIVISGEVAGIEAAMEACSAAGAKKVVRLPVSGAFHSPLMEYALDQLREGLAYTAFSAPKAPVIANVDAQPHDNPHEFPLLLERQLTAPVRWIESMEKAKEMGVTRAFELGAGKVLMGLMRGITRDIAVTPVESREALAGVQA